MGPGCAAPLAAAALQEGLPSPLPGPSPWGPTQWVGAALYVLLFLAALWGVWRLVRDVPEEGA